MKDIVISDAVKYIGADDKDLDLFESQYIVPNGVSYNSYVILDEKIAVMDTIDTRKTDEWKENLERVLDGRTPDYLVVSHLEPDHAGSIKEFADKYPEAKIVASAKAIAMLPQFFEIADLADRAVAVKEGEELSLGSHTLQFFMAPMVHWPGSSSVQQPHSNWFFISILPAPDHIPCPDDMPTYRLQLIPMPISLRKYTNF